MHFYIALHTCPCFLPFYRITIVQRVKRIKIWKVRASCMIVIGNCFWRHHLNGSSCHAMGPCDSGQHFLLLPLASWNVGALVQRTIRTLHHRLRSLIPLDPLPAVNMKPQAQSLRRQCLLNLEYRVISSFFCFHLPCFTWFPTLDLCTGITMRWFPSHTSRLR